jgi:hypothetical protein
MACSPVESCWWLLWICVYDPTFRQIEIGGPGEANFWMDLLISQRVLRARFAKTTLVDFRAVSAYRWPPALLLRRLPLYLG